MILSLNAPSGSTISLDLEKLFGARVELEGFQFITPPTNFRLVRGEKPLQEWQKGNSEIYDLQHCPGVKNWARDAHWFTNDFDHRHDVMTCGILSQDLAMQTRGLGLTFVLMIWLRQGTWAMQEPPIASRIRDSHNRSQRPWNSFWRLGPSSAKLSFWPKSYASAVARTIK